MKLILFNLALALTWVIVTGSFTLLNLVFGYVLGAISLHLIREQVGSRSQIGRGRRYVSLFFLFLSELLKSAWRVAIVVLKPKIDVKPGILAYKLDLEKDGQITLLANMITLTPGTLSVEVTEDRSTLFIHALDCSDPEGARADIANGFERKIKEAFR